MFLLLCLLLMSPQVAAQLRKRRELHFTEWTFLRVRRFVMALLLAMIA